MRILPINSSKPTTQLYVFHDITKKQPYPKICKDCKHFRADSIFPFDLKIGRCNKEIKVNLVDGSHIVPYAETVRVDDCKGKWWESDVQYTSKFLHPL